MSLHSAFKLLTLPPPYWKTSVATRPVKTLGVALLEELLLHSAATTDVIRKPVTQIIRRAVLV